MDELHMQIVLPIWARIEQFGEECAHQPVADETFQVLHACVWYSSIWASCLSWGVHPLYQAEINLPVYNMHMQAYSYYQQELNCCSFGQCADTGHGHFFSMAHSSKCSEKHMGVIHLHADVVTWQCCCIPVHPNYRCFWRWCTTFVMFLDTVARICWQSWTMSKEDPDGQKNTCIPRIK